MSGLMSSSDNTIPLGIYKQLSEEYAGKANHLRARATLLSTLRVILFAAFIYLGYQSISTGDGIYIISTIVVVTGFLLLIRIYDKVQAELAFYIALEKLNTKEINFLNGDKNAYPAGVEYVDAQHNYSYDLDLFGDGGLYPYLNRASTSYGSQQLAKDLLHPDTSRIVERQAAIDELKSKLNFRQFLQARGSMYDVKQEDLEQLKGWLIKPRTFSNKWTYFILFIFPLASSTCLISYLLTGIDKQLNLFYTLFVINLVVTFAFGRKISMHLNASTSVTKLLQQYAEQLKLIEGETFQSNYLQELKTTLHSEQFSAAIAIKRLGKLFNYLETIINLAVSVLLNGLFLFHVHILYSLEKWKINHEGKIFELLQILGSFESLSSFANLSYNNSSFTTPTPVKEQQLTTTEMGHPLINKEKRVANSISFEDQKFVILTGSNMSGKSTFLRTLGINMVLARAGANVCADSFIFYPFKVHVSMRITDSLQDSESFFYAELKRLQSIIQELESGEKSFIILDEILRGTNSNDKHRGTVGLIRKMIHAHAVGIIATHDLTVAELTTSHDDYLSNKCFESAIINDELIFDYKLKDGVCTKLSASFLMKKMEIID